MEPYVLLIVFILLVSLFTCIYPNQKSRNIFLALTFIYLYIFCCIRDFGVGKDISGYIRMYNETAFVAWDDWEYVYFENGYIALMKICNIIGLSARGFFFVIYAIILFPIYLLIKKQSPNALLSVIIYICFQFFVFDLTGLRQAAGMSICMLAYIIASEKYSRNNFALFIILVCLAATFHKSALIFIFAYPIMRLPITSNTIIIYCIVAMLCFGLNITGVRTLLNYFNKSHYDYSTEDSQQLGFTFVALLIIACVSVWTYYHTRQKKYQTQIKYTTNMLLASVCFLALFNGSVLLRSVMYYYFPMIISIPVFVKRLDNRNLRITAGLVTAIVFIVFFFSNEIHSFDVAPYRIGADIYKSL